MNIKTLSLTQPWASLLVLGEKKIETRNWTTKYRGTIAIHASKGFPKTAREFCLWREVNDALLAAGYHQLSDVPLGCVLGTVELVAMRPTIAVVETLTEQETMFGNYSAGRFAWITEHPVMFETPVPARGALGLWNWELST